MRKSLSRFVRNAVASAIAVYALMVCTYCGGVPGPSCDDPGVCGQSGRLLAIYVGSNAVRELPFGSFVVTPLIDDADGQLVAESTLYGMTFRTTGHDLRLYVTADDSVRVYDGVEPNTLLETIPVPGCTAVRDIALLDDDRLVVACSDTYDVVVLQRATGEVLRRVTCDAEAMVNHVNVVVTPAGRVLAGRTEICEFDPATDEPPRVVIGPGVEGAEYYDGLVFTPDGRLLVAANPDIGVLEFDGETFEFRRVLIPDLPGTVQRPRAMVIDTDGNLLVGGLSERIVRFDPTSGQFIGVVWQTNNRFALIGDLAFRP